MVRLAHDVGGRSDLEGQVDWSQPHARWCVHHLLVRSTLFRFPSQREAKAAKQVRSIPGGRLQKAC